MKLMRPIIFATLIDAFGIVPENLLMVAAVTLPVIEVIAGIGLLFDIKGSLSVITGLLLMLSSFWFTAFNWDWISIAVVLARKITKPKRFTD